jgi:F-type H+-transporting ATPase subunit b
MEEIIRQIGALVLGAIPTVLLFIVLVAAYQWLVQGPLSRTLKERHARTAGAVEDAQKAIALAEAKAEEYAAKLREARADVYKLREQRVKQWNTERDTALDDARKAAHQQVIQAIAEIEADAARARQSVQASAPELAALVVRVLLPQAAGGSR